MKLTLTRELESLIQRKLDSGQYETPQEVFESAVHRLDEDDRDFGWSTAALQAAIDVGWEEAELGETMSGDAARAELTRLRADRQRA